MKKHFRGMKICFWGVQLLGDEKTFSGDESIFWGDGKIDAPF
jgi:hypothetical protein